MDTALKRLFVIAAVCLILGFACQAFARPACVEPVSPAAAIDPIVGL